MKPKNIEEKKQLTSNFWVCLKCASFASATSSLITEICSEHMCESESDRHQVIVALETVKSHIALIQKTLSDPTSLAAASSSDNPAIQTSLNVSRLPPMPPPIPPPMPTKISPPPCPPLMPTKIPPLSLPRQSQASFAAAINSAKAKLAPPKDTSGNSSLRSPKNAVSFSTLINQVKSNLAPVPVNSINSSSQSLESRQNEQLTRKLSKRRKITNKSKEN